MLPFDDSFDGVLNGETIYDFMSVRSAISPEFDGFQYISGILPGY